VIKKNLYFILFVLMGSGSALPAADWPMWRFDAGRTACAPDELPDQLHRQWVRHYSAREPVWDDSLNQDLMPFDRMFEPIVLGDLMFISFNDRDKVVALDLYSGSQKWEFFANGPVRLPMAGFRDRIFCTSDDGYLYCLSARDGKLLWKFRGGPKERNILGNRRLISSWPARGGVVIQDDKVYFGASIWPFMGIFIYCLQAEDGRIIWQNDGGGTQYTVQPHNSPAFAGVAPQGPFSVSGKHLFVPGGRSVPACFDRFTGDLLYYHLAEFNKTGGAFVCANERYFFNHSRNRETDLYEVASGAGIGRKMGKYPVIDQDRFYMSGDSIIVRDAGNPNKVCNVFHVDASGDLIKSGSHLYAAGNGVLTALRITSNGSLVMEWQDKIKGRVGRLVAANRMLFAVTEEGEIIAYGGKPGKIAEWTEKTSRWQFSNTVRKEAVAILQKTGVKDGYALWYGVDNGDVLASFAQQSDLTIIAIDRDAAKVAALRRRFDAMGLPARRLHLLQGTLQDFSVPSYLASLVVINSPLADKALSKELIPLLHAVRPYGGKVWLSDRAMQKQADEKQLLALKKQNFAIERLGQNLCMTKSRSLAGSDNWTHQYGSMANTLMSNDELVKLPLGVLWFGGITNLNVLPRHGHGPPEQIVDGQLVIQGIDCLSARDVYTGRLLWKREMDSLGTLGQYYDKSYKKSHLVVSTNQIHIPGANARGTNFVATSDLIYVIQGAECHALDMASGKTVKIISLPESEKNREQQWGFIGVQHNYLVAGLDFVPFSTSESLQLTKAEKEGLNEKDMARVQVFGQFDYSASKTLVVMDRHSGTVKWQLESRYGFIHNAITASDRYLFCLDKLPAGLEKRLSRRGQPAPDDFRLLCIDLQTGRLVWERKNAIFGSWLSYSQEHDLLLQSTRPSRDMLIDEKGERMSVIKAASGELLWDKNIEYNNPPILRHDEIITDNASYLLQSGEKKYRQDPITGESLPWGYTRNYGCNYAVGAEHLLSFRSAAAGFYDLNTDGGTGNIGGFRSGCTSNLIAANGVLNSPDYTRTCQCSYQNQTSLAFVHMPELEYWTSNSYLWSGKPVQKVGLNLNAPGDRMAADKTLWLDFPSRGGKSPDLPVQYDSSKVKKLRRHSLFMKQDGNEWIGASGLVGPLDLKVTLSASPMLDAAYTIELYFAELEDIKPGERKFSVMLQGQQVLRDFDILQQAGAGLKTVVQSFPHVRVSDVLQVQCQPSPNAKCMPLLCGIKMVKEQ
jgi:outer membrane protein assembly factor BamB